MKNYLITGGAGFIGSNYIRYMLKKYPDIFIVNLDALTYAGNLENLETISHNNKYVFVRGDICDRQLVDDIFQKYKIDFCIHFAAESHVDRSIEDPDIFVKTNILGTSTLLNSAKTHWATNTGFSAGKKFVQVSTDEVYGSLGSDGLFTEQTPMDPHSPYSASKAAADLLVKSYFDTYHMPVNITRCSNNYGPYQFPEKLIPLIINNALNNKKIPVYGDGENVRDWLFVDDHITAIDLVTQKGIIGETYNIGGNNEYQNIEIVKKIIETMAQSPLISKHGREHITNELISYVTDRKGHDRRYAIDATKIKQELGWAPQYTFDSAIEKTINWYLNNLDWINEITSGDYFNYYDKMYGNHKK